MATVFSADLPVLETELFFRSLWIILLGAATQSEGTVFRARIGASRHRSSWFSAIHESFCQEGARLNVPPKCKPLNISGSPQGKINLTFSDPRKLTSVYGLCHNLQLRPEADTLQGPCNEIAMPRLD
jgi:hypothetical protein